MAVRLGPFEIAHPFILAPMAGVTDSPFRRLMRQTGCPLVVSELISANGIEHAGRRTLDYLKFQEDERPIGLQIFGDDPSYVSRASQKVEAAGADFVDINMGCPVPKVVKRGAGASLCRDLVALGHVLEAAVKAVRIPVTIKIRTGWDADSRNASDVVHVAANSGVAWVVIHGRTRAQGYSGLADWDFISEVKAHSSLPIIGNGDVTSPELAVQRLQSSGVDAVMIGRGMLRNPFIFEQAAELLKNRSYTPVSVDRYLKLFDVQRGFHSEHYDSRKALIQARKFLAWYSAGIPGCHEFRKQVFVINDEDQLWLRAKDFFVQNFSKRDLSSVTDSFLMGGHG